MEQPSIVVCAKLRSSTSSKIVRWIAKTGDRTTLVHVCTVLLTIEDCSEEQRRQDQAEVRQQFGSILQAAGLIFRLHIIRLSHQGQASAASATAFTARALAAKAATLRAQVLVAGDNSTAACLPEESSPVTECLRSQSYAVPVLAISSRHPLLAPYLPAIAEEPVQELLRSLSRSFGAQGLPSYPSLTTAPQLAFSMA